MIARGIKSTGSTMALLALLVGVVLALVPAAAQAADDTVKNLSVTYDIQPDGSVSVRYEIDWRFGSDGRHGIDFSIATREPWLADLRMDVVYDVSNITVSSPSGAPDSFTEREKELGSAGSVELRIGDPAETVEGRDATYVIAYEVRGALRTFDGIPEFYWDVTSEDFPAIERFTVRINAPGGVQKARCLVGSAKCGADLVDGQATLTGSDVRRRKIVTAVAGMAPGAVSAAEPTLEERRLQSPLLTDVKSFVEVRSDGSTHVDQTLTYRMPALQGYRPAVHWELPSRRPFSGSQDQVFTITHLRVDGAAEVKHLGVLHGGGRRSHEDTSFDVYLQESEDDQVLLLSYDVEGTVTSDGDTAMASWILTPEDLYYSDSVDFVWTLPADVRDVSCTRRFRNRDEPQPCSLAPTLLTAGPIIEWRPGPDDFRSTFNVWITAEVPSVSVGNAGPLLEPSLDAADWWSMVWSIVGATAAFVGLGVAGALLRRGTFRKDRRWSGVAPGLTAARGSAVHKERRPRSVPVRFEEPDCSLLVAGLVRDRGRSSAHTAALLVHMATLGAVQIQSKPLRVKQVSANNITEPVEMRIYEQATKRATDIGRERLRTMNRAVAKAQDYILKDASLFAPEAVGRRERAAALFVFFVVVAVAFPVAGWLLPGWLGPRGDFIAVAAIVGSFAGTVSVRRREPPRALEPDGTALRDQVDGFRHYIATAEANQLNFEADRDIYRRYLPWAVLFGLSKRWTKVCQELADAGRISPLDTTWWIGESSASSIAGSMSSFSGGFSSVGTSSSSSSSSGFFSGGDSGGSSGFSSDSSGGGGGGGTSASSW